MRASKHGRTALLVATSIALWALGLALPAGATTLYVDASNASGTEDGSAVNPFTTIQAAVAAAVSGDTVRVAAGSYNGPIAITGKGLRLLGVDPARTVISGGGSVISVTGTFAAGQNVVEIAGFQLWGAPGAGVNFSSSTVIGRVHNCILSANAYGVLVTSGGTAAAYNNVIEGSSNTGARSENSSSIAITNNVFMNNTYGAYANNASGVSSSYNYYFTNTNTIGANYNSSYSSTNDVVGVNPLFTDVNTGNFCLQAASPCVNAGSPSSANNDPDGTRNDIGVCGGPGAADFWPRPLGGPIVTEVTVTPHDVPAGGTIQVRAKGKVR